MSRGVPEPKLTAMDAMIDKLTGAIFIFQIVVVMVLGVAGNVWKDIEARKVSDPFSFFSTLFMQIDYGLVHLLVSQRESVGKRSWCD